MRPILLLALLGIGCEAGKATVEDGNPTEGEDGADGDDGDDGDDGTDGSDGSDGDDTDDPDPDEDGDGFPASEDCDDDDPDAHPGGDEGDEADGVDQDCSGIADDVTVCEDGDFSTIQSAIDEAPEDFVIAICPGTYAENLVIDDRSLTLLGLEGADATIVDAGGLGRGLEITDSRDVRIEGLSFINGLAEQGAGIAVLDAEAELVALIVSGNSATTFGGGVLGSGGELVIEESRIESNLAGEGGGIAITDGEARIEGNTISANHSSDVVVTYNGALGGGGGIWGGVDVEIVGNTISGNTADANAGGIYLLQPQAPFTDNIVSDNIAGNDAGGIYINYGQNEISRNTFSRNAAGDDAGGLRLYVSACNIEDNVLEDNTAVDGGGGGKFSHRGSTARGNAFYRNIAGGSGGGFQLDNDTTIFRDSIFVENTAWRGGGFFWKESYAEMSLVDAVFEGNTATGDGGALAGADNAHKMTLVRVEVYDSEAPIGAGIFATASVLETSGVLLSGNEASTAGGAIALSESTGILNYLTAWSNEAPSGGGVYASGGTVSISGAILSENTGAAVAASGSTVSIVYSDLFGGTLVEGISDPTGNDGNLSTDPLLNDPSAGDFGLQSTSPCEDAGDPADEDPDGSRADMGTHGGPDAL